MEYRVYDLESKKERTWVDSKAGFTVGSIQTVTIRKGAKIEVHHFKILEVLSHGK